MWDLDYWQSDDWKVVNQRLQDMESKNVGYSPSRKRLFRSLSSIHLDDCKVCIIGDSPSVHRGIADGFAFTGVDDFAAAYRSDLRREPPEDRSLWGLRGVLLWDSIPISYDGMRFDWDEWTSLNVEVIRRVGRRGVVYAFIGPRARRYSYLVNDDRQHKVIEVNEDLLVGSRLFSKINDYLNQLKLGSIDWP